MRAWGVCLLAATLVLGEVAVDGEPHGEEPQHVGRRRRMGGPTKRGAEDDQPQAKAGRAPRGAPTPLDTGADERDSHEGDDIAVDASCDDPSMYASDEEFFHGHLYADGEIIPDAWIVEVEPNATDDDYDVIRIACETAALEGIEELYYGVFRAIIVVGADEMAMDPIRSMPGVRYVENDRAGGDIAEDELEMLMQAFPEEVVAELMAIADPQELQERIMAHLQNSMFLEEGVEDDAGWDEGFESDRGLLGEDEAEP